jgi:hypothetical protein
MIFGPNTPESEGREFRVEGRRRSPGHEESDALRQGAEERLELLPGVDQHRERGDQPCLLLQRGDAGLVAAVKGHGRRFLGGFRHRSRGRIADIERAERRAAARRGEAEQQAAPPGRRWAFRPAARTAFFISRHDAPRCLAKVPGLMIV